MAAQGFGAKPAFETHEVVGLHRPADRHRWHQGGRRRRRLATTKSAQRLMYRRNQSTYLIDWDAVFGDKLLTISATKWGLTFCELLPSAISSVLPLRWLVYVVFAIITCGSCGYFGRRGVYG
jgi:hypothetical protein